MFTPQIIYLILLCSKLSKRITLHVDELLSVKKDGTYTEEDVRMIEEAILESMNRPKTTGSSRRESRQRAITPLQTENPSVPQMDFTHVRRVLFTLFCP